MQLARKLTLLVMAAMSLAALAAPQALAQEPEAHDQTPNLEGRVEPGGTLCPPVTPSPAPAPGPTTTTGGCRVHIGGRNTVIVGHIFAMEFTDTTCDIEFDARLDGSVEGYLTHVEMTQGTLGTCTRRPCGSSPTMEGRAWSTYAHEELNPPKEVLTLLFCVWGTADMTNTHCEVDIPFTETEGGVPTNHRYHFTPNDAACDGVAGFRGELTGEWKTEMVTAPLNGEGQSEQQIEINHV